MGTINLSQLSLIKLVELLHLNREMMFQSTTQILLHHLLKLELKKPKKKQRKSFPQLRKRLPDQTFLLQELEKILIHQVIKKKLIRQLNLLRPKRRPKRKRLMPRKRKKRIRNQSQKMQRAQLKKVKKTRKKERRKKVIKLKKEMRRKKMLRLLKEMRRKKMLRLLKEMR